MFQFRADIINHLSLQVESDAFSDIKVLCTEFNITKSNQ